MNPAKTQKYAGILANVTKTTALPLNARIILNVFAKMTTGFMRLELPDGRVQEIGHSDAKVRAMIQIRDWNFFKRCVLFGDIGFGEAYVAGEWTTDDITAVISWFIINLEDTPGMSGSSAKKMMFNVLMKINRWQHLIRPNSLKTSRRNIQEHYDLGNDFYKLFLDRTMTYSAALFEGREQTLAEAQRAKYDRLCRKLKLQSSDHVLEIGSGWGGFSLHAAKNYGCKITTITISEEQFKYAKALFAREGLSAQIEIQLLDYRKITGHFDKIASIEMLEAVGDNYLETYFAKCHEVLKPGGLLGLQIITCPDARYAELRKNVDWIQKHIFPGSLLLSLNRIGQALNRTGDLFLHDLHDMGLSYAETLKRWRIEFNRHHDEVQKLGFSEQFARKWNYYFSYCEAAFVQRNISVVQAIYTRPNNPTLMRLEKDGSTQ